MIYKKPFLKIFININSIYIQYKKILNFKKKKWIKFLINYKNYLTNSKFKKFSLIDHNRLLIDNYSNKYSSYKNNYKYFYSIFKNIKLFYFSIINKKFLKYIYLNYALNLLERRLDILTVRSKFFLTLNLATHFIKKGYIFINKIKIKIHSYIINSGQFIKINIVFYKYNQLLIYSFKWAIPLNNLIINYISREFLFLNYIYLVNLTIYFPYYLKLKNIFY